MTGRSSRQKGAAGALLITPFQGLHRVRGVYLRTQALRPGLGLVAPSGLNARATPCPAENMGKYQPLGERERAWRAG